MDKLNPISAEKSKILADIHQIEPINTFQTQKSEETKSDQMLEEGETG